MKYSETVAYKCRYGNVAERLFGMADIIWDDSVDGWQGSAAVLAYMPDGTFAHYEWNYGSCSGCDDWEYRNLSDDKIEQEMRRDTVFLSDVASTMRYTQARHDSSMAEAFADWLNKRVAATR